VSDLRRHSSGAWKSWYHGSHETQQNRVPRSWLLTFTDGSAEVTARCYLHSDEYAPQGWYPRFDRVIKLSKSFKMPAGGW